MLKSSLLRRESFGGTLFNAASGRRIYITEGEFGWIATKQSVPKYLQSEVGADTDDVMIRIPTDLPAGNFSCADTVFFEITRVCNIKCTFCFNNSGPNHRLANELSDDRRLAVVGNLITSGVQEIRLTGGEPLILGDLTYKIIEMINCSGLRSSIGTNGILVKPSVADKLAKAGLHSAVVSVDGMEDAHDSIRGQGSWKKTLDGISELKRVGVPVRVNAVVMKSNIEEVVRVVQCFSDIDVPVMIRRLIPAGRADNMSNEMLTQGEYNALRLRLEPLTSDPTKKVRGHYIKSDKVEPRIRLPFERQACSAGHRGMVVLPDGNVQTCGFLGPLGEPSVGDVSTEKFSDIWHRLVDSEHIESMRSLLPGYNATTVGPKTNCLAIALAANYGDTHPLKFVRRLE
ncbi:MAG: Radical domain protein [Patescibacteria group bacterium]|jgi:MoaA/NifB/PqqE/SkfB family radical SAM enzyme|nr:Radical domain protein [Patescibacteria group bacterium]